MPSSQAVPSVRGAVSAEGDGCARRLSAVLPEGPVPDTEKSQPEPGDPKFLDEVSEKSQPERGYNPKFLDEAHAERICAAQSLQELSGLKVTMASCPTCGKHCPDQMRCRQRAEQAAFRQRSEGPAPYILQGWKDGSQRPNIGTWMVEMVHRVHLNDPKLHHLDFACFCIPTGEQEPRILPKLLRALGKNTHLKDLLLGNTGLRFSEANLADLSASLRGNSTLRRLDLQANYLEPNDLKVIFQSITQKSALQDLRVNFQASLAAPPVDFAQMMLSEAGTDIYKAAQKALEESRQLLKLDLILVQRHWRDQICRGLMKNLEEKRKDGREACLPQKVSCPSTA